MKWVHNEMNECMSFTVWMMCLAANVLKYATCAFTHFPSNPSVTHYLPVTDLPNTW